MEELKWEKRVPILKSQQIMKHLGIAFGIPFGLLIIFLAVFKAYYGLILVGLLIGITFLVVAIVYRGTYDVTFRLNKKGIYCANQKSQKKKAEAIATAAVILGAAAGNPTAMGAGMLSAARTELFVPWKRVRKVKYLDNQKCIMIYGGFGDTIGLFCLNENYGIVKNYVYNNIDKK